MPYAITVEFMLNSRPKLADANRELMRWKRGDIVAVYKRKPDGKPGMPRTVYIHVDNVPDRINLNRIRWTLTLDRGMIVDINGDLILKHRCRWRLSNTKVPAQFWNTLNLERVSTITWTQFRNRVAHRDTDIVILENDLTTGPV